METFPLQVALAVLMPIVLQWLKAQRWFAFMNFHGGKLNATTAAIAALLGGLGIGFQFNYDTHQLIVSGLSWAAVWAAAQHWLIQWAMQHAAYKTIIAPPQAGVVQAQQRDTVTAEQPKP